MATWWRPLLLGLLLVAACSPAEPGTTPTSTSATTVAPTTTMQDTTTTTVPADPNLPIADGREEVPWDRVGPGWYLALYDSSPANPERPEEARKGPVVLYLVDSAANRYRIAAWPPLTPPRALVDTVASGALLAFPGETLDDTEYRLLDLESGEETVVYRVGFPEAGFSFDSPVSLSRPTGANLVVHRSDGSEEWLERRAPDGAVLATLFRQEYREGEKPLSWLYGSEGTSVVVGHRDGVALVSNQGGRGVDIWAPEDTDCRPVRWWDEDSFLAACYGREGSAPRDEYGNPHLYYGRLWLLERDGSPGGALTAYPSQTPIVVDFGYHDAWPKGNRVLLQWSGDCGAAAVELLRPDGSGERLRLEAPPPLVVDGVEMVDVVGDRIGVYGWQGCDAWVGTLFTTDLTGDDPVELVPILGEARGVIGVRGLATVYP